MARSFYISKLWQGILLRLGVLETYQGTIPPAEDYNTVADVRALASHTNGDRIFCLENQIIYSFVAASMSVDNGSTILKPTDINVGDPGRWLMEQQMALKNHSHTEYAVKVTTPVQTRFLKSDASGSPVEGAEDASSFAASDHTHAGYALDSDLTTVAGDLATLAGTVATKADKYAVTTGDIGKPAVFNAEGNVVPGATIKFFQFYTGPLVAGVVKPIRHDQNMLIGYIPNAREADNSNNTIVAILKPNDVEPENIIDVKSSENVPDPGLIIQILGA